jgi:hypothetical protein
MNIYDDDEEDGDLEFFRLLRAAFLKEEVRTVEEPDDRTPGQKVIDALMRSQRHQRRCIALLKSSRS